MKVRRFVLVLAAGFLVAASCGCGLTRQAPPLKQGDRIVFLGDSITAGGGGKTGYITLVQEAIDAKHKDLAVTTVNADISGNKVPDLQRRLDKDVIAKKPTVVFIYIGINDVWHWRKTADGTMVGGTPKDQFEAGLKEIIARLRPVDARVILCTPTTIGEKSDGSNPHDAMLDEYAAISRKVAQESSVQMLDLRKAFIDYLKTHNPDQKDRGILTADSVHLNDAGNRLVADQMLAALGLAAPK
ncbi:MAG TPA: SGNH/GDSL hydrolase family protein [Phycisphaerae bacterium]|nr:SGNH/GDSL hydrolase family protein [Phycisphaerae bacterium]